MRGFTLLLFFCQASFSITLYDGEKSEKFANDRLAKKMERVYLNPDNTEYEYAKMVGLQNQHAWNQDKTPFSANMTYHGVDEYCERWVGHRNCAQWRRGYQVDPKTHQQGDRSALEDAVLTSTNGDQFGIWDLQGQNLFNQDGSLNYNGISRVSIKAPIKNRIQTVATKAAKKQLDWTKDTEGESEDAMGNIEAMRAITGSLTKMYRNRMIAIIGNQRVVNEKGIEVLQNISIRTCADYPAAVGNDLDQFRIEQKTNPQKNLDLTTRNVSMQERVRRCEQAQRMSAYATNVSVVDGNVQAGDPNDADTFEALAGANLLAIDKVGTDPRQFPLPARVQLTDEDIKADFQECAVGGRECWTKRQTNATDLKQYNRALKGAEKGSETVASRTNFYKAISTKQFEIEPGSINMVTLNGPSPEQRAQIKETGSVLADVKKDPGNKLEEAPIDLVVRDETN